MYRDGLKFSENTNSYNDGYVIFPIQKWLISYYRGSVSILLKLT